MMTRNFVVLLVTLTAILFLPGCGKKGKEKGESGGAGGDSSAAIRVVAAPIQTQPFEDWAVFSADLRGAEDAVLTAGAGGRVARISEVGKTVKAGEALCDIESARFQALLLQAKSAVELAQSELERQKVNLEKGYVGKSMLNKAELDYQSARVAQFQAERAYEDSRCQAPFSGVLVSRFAERFQTVPPGAPTVRVANTSRLVAVVSIPESESGDFHNGQAAEFMLVQNSSKVFKGILRSVDRAVEAKNRTLTARIEFQNSGDVLRPGMVGNARILRKKYDSAIVIPSTAVLRLQEGTAVMVVKNGLAEKAVVRLGAALGESVLVADGLSAGDILITMGAFQVSPGTRVAY